MSTHLFNESSFPGSRDLHGMFLTKRCLLFSLWISWKATEKELLAAQMRFPAMRKTQETQRWKVCGQRSIGLGNWNDAFRWRYSIPANEIKHISTGLYTKTSFSSVAPAIDDIFYLLNLEFGEVSRAALFLVTELCLSAWGRSNSNATETSQLLVDPKPEIQPCWSAASGEETGRFGRAFCSHF